MWSKLSPRGELCSNDCFLELWNCDEERNGRQIKARNIHHPNLYFQTWDPGIHTPEMCWQHRPPRRAGHVSDCDGN